MVEQPPDVSMRRYNADLSALTNTLKAYYRYLAILVWTGRAEVCPSGSKRLRARYRTVYIQLYIVTGRLILHSPGILPSMKPEAICSS